MAFDLCITILFIFMFIEKNWKFRFREGYHVILVHRFQRKVYKNRGTH